MSDPIGLDEPLSETIALAFDLAAELDVEYLTALALVDAAAVAEPEAVLWRAAA